MSEIHGSKGAYVAGDWVPIEECAEKYNISGNTSGDCYRKKYSKECESCPRSRSAHSAEKKDGTYDVVVIGAGCIGGAIARELSKTTASVLLLEGADDVTQGATKGNSGIVHAGYDDKPGSVRAKFCWPGNQMFPQLDAELHFGFEKCGSLVVARGKDDEKILNELMERGRENGVKNLRIVQRTELREMEPFINEDATCALFSPDAGNIIPYEYAIALCENAVDNGVELRIRRVVKKITKDPDGIFTIEVGHWEPTEELLTGMSKWKKYLPYLLGILFVANSFHFYEYGQTMLGTLMNVLITLGLTSLFASKSGKDIKPSRFTPSKGTDLDGFTEIEKIRTRYIVNSAGCQSDYIAEMLGDKSFKIKPRMGEYILLHKNQGHKTRHILFPAPHPFLGKGVLVQKTLWGNLILGPTARDTLQKNKKTGEYEINPKVRDEPNDNILSFILGKCKNLVPDLDAAEVIHTFSGARAKNTREDWIIEPCPTEKNVIYAAGIDSPGIAGSPAIAVEVCRLLKQAGAPISEMDPAFNPNRAPIVVPKDGWRGIKAGPVGKYTNPKENVICKCEKVTEAEVIEACRRSLPIDSTQAIRKRTRAGMGHCQGDPDNYGCEARVVEIIARERRMNPKDVGTRPWPASSMLSERFIKEKEKKKFEDLASKNYQGPL
uniref:FAD dependent oxidoreductase domain-containing protein n=1 Tax=Aplanochytrium stocchinoi TaxID=215587 RepID=A0A6S8B8R7_9STRA